MTRTYRTSFASTFLSRTWLLLAPFVLAVALVLGGCDSNGAADESDIAALVISPDSASLAVGERLDFSAAALTADGDTVRDVALNWASTDPDVFTVEKGGIATGRKPGTAFCTIEVASLRFTGRDSAFVRVF